MKTRNHTALPLAAVALAAFAIPVTPLSAATVLGSFDFNTIVQTHNTQNSWTHQVVVNDSGSAATATIDFTLSLSGGGNFTKLDGDIRVGGSGGSDINSLDAAEAVTLTVSLDSSTGASDVSVNTTHFGFRDGWAASTSSWSSSATAGPVAVNVGAGSGGTDYALDGAADFSSIMSSDYAGTLDITSGFIHLSDNANGISYSVDFTPIPEPSTAILAGIFGLGLALRRRRQSAAG